MCRLWNSHIATGEVPTIESHKESLDFFSNVDSNTLKELVKKETEFVQREYELSPGAAERIADRIKGSSDGLEGIADD